MPSRAMPLSSREQEEGRRKQEQDAPFFDPLHFLCTFVLDETLDDVCQVRDFTRRVLLLRRNLEGERDDNLLFAARGTARCMAIVSMIACASVQSGESERNVLESIPVPSLSFLSFCINNYNIAFRRNASSRSTSFSTFANLLLDASRRTREGRNLPTGKRSKEPRKAGLRVTL